MAESPAEKGLFPARLGLAVLVVLALGIPLAVPLAESLHHFDALRELDWNRLARVGANTLILAAGIIVLTLPAGTFLAFLLFRSDLPRRRFFLSLVVVSLFVPLPVTTSAWQGFLGEQGWLPQVWWGPDAVRLPWGQGLIPSIWIHSWAGLPWVILIVGFGFQGVERELEEEALLHRSPRKVFGGTTLPRCRWALLSAALFLVVQAAGEICVVYMTQTATFAEEVHLQFSLGDESALARSVFSACLGAAILGLILVRTVPRLVRSVPDLAHADRPALLFPLGSWRLPATVAATLGSAGLLLLPLASMVRRLGMPGRGNWSIDFALGHLADHFALYGLPVLRMLLVAAATGLLTAFLALWTCWLLRGRRILTLLVLMVSIPAVALPGPIAGIGLMETIRWLLQNGLHGLRPVLYDDGPAALMWVHLIRFFPLGLAMLWPVVSRVPQPWLDGLRLEGAGPLEEFRSAIWPYCRGVFATTVVALAALSLGEVASACRVDTPGWETFAKILFDRMHYGVDSNVAAVALVLLIETLPVAAVVGWWCTREVQP